MQFFWQVFKKMFATSFGLGLTFIAYTLFYVKYQKKRILLTFPSLFADALSHLNWGQVLLYYYLWQWAFPKSTSLTKRTMPQLKSTVEPLSEDSMEKLRSDLVRAVQSEEERKELAKQPRSEEDYLVLFDAMPNIDYRDCVGKLFRGMVPKHSPMAFLDLAMPLQGPVWGKDWSNADHVQPLVYVIQTKSLAKMTGLPVEKITIELPIAGPATLMNAEIRGRTTALMLYSNIPQQDYFVKLSKVGEPLTLLGMFFVKDAFRGFFVLQETDIL